MKPNADVEPFLPNQLADPVWRLTSGFYQIRSEEGKAIPFIPTPQQRKVIEAVYVNKFQIIGIPKARQVRMSTLICLICLDTALFGTGNQISILDKDVGSARKKMDEKIWFAYDRLPDSLKDELWEVQFRSLHPSAAFKIAHKLHGKQKDGSYISSSAIYAGDNPQGTTNQLLFCSEWAEVAVMDPSKSTKYLRGAWPTAEKGLRIIESTWKGGKSGEVYGIMKWGLDSSGLPLADHDVKHGLPKVLFFPWYVLPDRRIPGDPSEVKPEVVKYFAGITAQTGDVFDHEQMLWYQRTVLPLGHEGRSTYPSIIHECWDGLIEGAIWATAIMRARDLKCVGPLDADPDLEVDTFWDLGAPENQPCGYVQHRASVRRIINLDSERSETLPGRIGLLKAKGYRYGTHFLPHDGGNRQANGRTYRDEFEAELIRQGVSGRVVMLPRTSNRKTRINHVTRMLEEGRLELDDRLTKLMESMNGYRWQPDKTRDGFFLDDPVKDWTTHVCDVVGYIAEAELGNHLPTTGAMTTRNLYFDADQIRNLREKQATPQIWTVEQRGDTFQHIAARMDSEGWLRVWESPIVGIPYLIGLTQGAVVVWRASFRDQETLAEDPHRLVAACVAEEAIQATVLYRWCSVLSRYYGDVPVVADVTSLPGAVDELRRLGIAVLARRQSRQDRRLGQQGNEIRKPGHTFGERERQEAYQDLQAMLRDQHVSLSCPVSLRQLEGFTNGQDGEPSLLEGCREEWVRAHALTLSCIAQSVAARPRRQPTPSPQDYMGERPKKRSLV